MAPVSEIKLIRTDTTLDLSQKAEKVCVQGDPKRLIKEWFRNSVAGGFSSFCDVRSDSNRDLPELKKFGIGNCCKSRG